MRYIDKLLTAYRDEIITQSQLEKDMADTGYMSDNEGLIKQARIRTHIMKISAPYPVMKTPEEVVLEQEAQEEILTFLAWIRESIGEEDWQFLTWSVVDRLTLRKIGAILGISKQSAYLQFKRIKERIASVLQYYPGNLESLRDCFLAPQSTKEMSLPTPLGYPQDFLQSVSVGGHWGVSRKYKQVYVSDDTCMVPEYLEGAFGDDSTVCTMCEGGKKCKRLPEKNNSSRMITYRISSNAE